MKSQTLGTSLFRLALGAWSIATLGSCTGRVSDATNESIVSLQRAYDSACKEGKCPCPSPLGLIAHGGTATAYSESEVACEESCSSREIKLKCENGKFDREATNLSFACQVAACRACTAGNNQVPHGFAVTMYSRASVSCLQSCEDVKRSLVCKDGTLIGSLTGPSADGLDGSYSFAACSASSCTCAVPNAGAITLNASLKLYKRSTGTCSSPCSETGNSADRTCRNQGTVAAPNPVLDGDPAFQHPNCAGPTAQQCNCVLPDAAKTALPHGRSQVLFSAPTPLQCKQCTELQKTVYCDSGTLYDKPSTDSSRIAQTASALSSYKNLSCDQAASPDCSVNSICIADGTSKTLYSKTSLACGDDPAQFTALFACSKAATLRDGSAYSPSADPAAAAWQLSQPISSCTGCRAPWGVGFPIGAKMVAYKLSQQSSNSCGGGCKMIEFTCQAKGVGAEFTSGDPGVDSDLKLNPRNYAQSCENACNQEGGGAPPRFCLLPWQNSFVSADSLIPMWNQRTAVCGDSCQNHFRLGRCQLRTGTFDAGLQYIYQSCTDIPCRSLRVSSITPSFRPPAGGSVQLTGSGFTASTQVRIGSWTCASPTVGGGGSQLNCVLPAGATGSYDVLVSNGSEQAMLPKGFSYYTGACTAGPGSRVFRASGAMQTFTVPTGCSSIRVKAWGAGGGGRKGSANITQFGGAGGRSSAAFPVSPGAVLTVVVGGAGSGGNYNGASGGGYSGVFTGSPSQSSALIIAGGGGGAGDPSGCNLGGTGGEGGGAAGQSHGSCSGGGGTQSAPGTGGGAGAPGAALQGGSAGTSLPGGFGGGGSGVVSISSGGGGGGGWFGGGAGSNVNRLGGSGGGGSGYLAPSASGGSTTTGSGNVPPMVVDPDYVEGIAVGGGASGKGGDGLVIIAW